MWQLATVMMWNFSGTSVSVDTVTNPDFEAFIQSAAATALGLTVGLTTTFSINPASALIGLETLAFVDLALFEEELTLFGTIGTGISLSLAQCEEQEGCAPSVTEDELNTIIATLKARVEELERRLVDEESKGDDSVQDELESLIERFNLELAEFQDYLSKYKLSSQ